MKPLALTGGIASGKSTASQYLLESGISIIYSTDAICHELYEKLPLELMEAFRAKWGEGIVDDGGRVDRAALAKLLFTGNEPQKSLEELNRIVHPEVKRRLEDMLMHTNQDGKTLVLVEIPLLFEAGWERHVSRSIAVWTPRERQITQLMTRAHLTRTEAERRLSVQLTCDETLARADYGLINNGGLEHLRRQCARLAAHLKSTL